jgi:hypothetical protein
LVSDQGRQNLPAQRLEAAQHPAFAEHLLPLGKTGESSKSQILYSNSVPI